MNATLKDAFSCTKSETQNVVIMKDDDRDEVANTDI
jgi:hypothetical protein